MSDNDKQAEPATPFNCTNWAEAEKQAEELHNLANELSALPLVKTIIKQQDAQAKAGFAPKDFYKL